MFSGKRATIKIGQAYWTGLRNPDRATLWCRSAGAGCAERSRGTLADFAPRGHEDARSRLALRATEDQASFFATRQGQELLQRREPIPGDGLTGFAICQLNLQIAKPLETFLTAAASIRKTASAAP